MPVSSLSKTRVLLKFVIFSAILWGAPIATFLALHNGGAEGELHPPDCLLAAIPLLPLFEPGNYPLAPFCLLTQPFSLGPVPVSIAVLAPSIGLHNLKPCHLTTLSVAASILVVQLVIAAYIVSAFRELASRRLARR